MGPKWIGKNIYIYIYIYIYQYNVDILPYAKMDTKIK